MGLGGGGGGGITWKIFVKNMKLVNVLNCLTFEMAMPGRALGRLGSIGSGCFSAFFFPFLGPTPWPALEGGPGACLGSGPDQEGPGASLGPVTKEGGIEP